MKFEKYTTGTGQKIMVHALANCKGEHCVIHNPSDHPMRAFPTHWRGDRGLMERVCPHGVGHPDPDDVGFYLSLHKEERHYAVHGCDGCCQGAKHD